MELLVDFFADIYEKNPLEAHRGEDGYVQFTDTGDLYIDKWEEQIALGEHPDLTEAFSQADLEKYLRLRSKTKGLVSQPPQEVGPSKPLKTFGDD